MHNRALLSSSIPIDGLPAKVRLFRWGLNDTTKGEFLFDEVAAQLVLSAFEKHGVDLMFDLEHLSLDTRSENFNPNAQAWAKRLVAEPGEDGGLFADEVRWTPEGATRLSNKTQRYVSPAFLIDDDNRIVELINVALVAMPATHSTPALVAAHRIGEHPEMNQNAHAVVAAMRAQLDGMSSRAIRLADEVAAEPSKGKVAQIIDQMKAAKDSIAAAEQALKGKDIDAIFAAMADAAKVMSDFTSALEAFNGGAAKPEEPAEPTVVESTSEASPPEGEQKMSREERNELIALRVERDHRLAKERADAEAREAKERLDAIADLVRLGHITPALAWEGGVVNMPSKMFASMKAADIRATVGKAPAAVKLNQAPSTPYATASGDEVEISQYEANRVRVYAEKRRRELTQIGAGSEARDPEEVIDRYREHKRQQVEPARDTPRFAQLARGVEQQHVLLDSRGERLVQLAAVTPIETFGTSSQRALEEFRLEYNMALAAEPRTWAEQIGNVLPNGGLKTTFPLNFDAVNYIEKQAQNPAASVAQNKDVEVTKREFFAGKQVNLRRLQMGDFAYVQNWAQQAQQLARARVTLRNKLVTALLEGNGTWVDGKAFFAADHKVNPFDANIKLRTSATWSNYQSSASPLAVGTLSSEKATSVQVALANGEELEYEYDAILIPSVLKETAQDILDIKDIVLDAASSLNSVNNVMGAVKNPHFNSGMAWTKGSQLAQHATPASSDWYLYSRAAIAAGLAPFVISEDAAEELRVWDEASDFYKDTGDIKVTSHVYINAAFMWPHSIRLVKGA